MRTTKDRAIRILLLLAVCLLGLSAASAAASSSFRVSLVAGYAPQGRSEAVLSLFETEPFGAEGILLEQISVRIDGLDYSEWFQRFVQRSRDLPEYVHEGQTAILVRFPLPFLRGGAHTLTTVVPGGDGSLETTNLTFQVPERQRLGIADTTGLLDSESHAPFLSLYPADGAMVRNSTPELLIDYSDSGLDLDTDSLRVILNGVDKTSRFDVRDGSAHFVVPQNESLPDGVNTLVVLVADRSGEHRIETSRFVVCSGLDERDWVVSPVTGSGLNIGHLNSDFQDYGDGPYFHHGLDLRAPAQSDVYASVGGRVERVGYHAETAHYFEVAIRDESGFLWEYHHIEEGSVPPGVSRAMERGLSILPGTKIGEIVPWPMQDENGDPFHHVHLNIRDEFGRYLNGLNFLPGVRDTLAPVLDEIFFCQNESDEALNAEGDSLGTRLSGDVDIVARAFDLVPGSSYELGIHSIEYAVEELTGDRSHHLLPTLLWRFDELPGGSAASRFVHTIFKDRLFVPETGWVNTVGDYSGREFYYVVTNRDGNELSAENGFWDTDSEDSLGKPLFPNGLYRVTVKASDFTGNTTSFHTLVVVAN